MKKNINEIRYQACNICNSMLRNINDNFLTVSFDFLDDGNLLVKVVLKQKGKSEVEYIDDMIAELSALQESNCVSKPQVEVGSQHSPLRHLVYQRSPAH